MHCFYKLPLSPSQAGIGTGHRATTDMQKGHLISYSETPAQQKLAGLQSIRGTKSKRNRAITTIATGVALYAKSNPRFGKFARHLRGKINKQGTGFLKRAGLPQDT